MECTQVLLSDSIEELSSTNEKLPVATLQIEGVFHTIYNSENIIGREDSCDIIIKNNAISSKHAIIEAEDPTVHLLYDLGSTNKTKLGKMTLKPHVRYHINNGDVVTFGNVSGLYNVSLQLENTPEKGKPTLVPETPERDQQTSGIVSDSSPEEKKDNDFLDTSDMDMFDEKECDNSTVQQNVIGSSEEFLKKNDKDIYEMDTVTFDSNELFPTDHNDKGSRDSSGKPSTSDKIDIISGDGASKIENDQSIYEICTQSSVGDDDAPDACDSTMKAMHNGKNNMEISSSIEDDKGNGELNDISVYDLHTQNPFVDETLVSKRDSKSNNYEWEDFPEIASPVGLDTSNADDLECPSTSKLEDKSLSTKATVGIGEIRAVKRSEEDSYSFAEVETQPYSDSKNMINKNDMFICQEDFKERATEKEEDFLPASQNIDIFERSNIQKDSLKKNKTCDDLIPSFNESDDETMSNLATQFYPVSDNGSKKCNKEICKDTSSSFLFEPASQPTDAEEIMKDSTATEKVDETLSSSFFESATQPGPQNYDYTNSKVANKHSGSRNDNFTGAANQSTTKTIANIFEAATQPIIPNNDNESFETVEPSACNNDNLDETADPNNGTTNDDNIFDAATQPVVPNIDHFSKSATHHKKTNNSFEDATPSVKENDGKGNLESALQPSLDSSFKDFQPLPSTKNVISVETGDMEQCDIRKELKEATKSFLINECSDISDIRSKRETPESYEAKYSDKTGSDSCSKSVMNSKILLGNNQHCTKNDNVSLSKSFFEGATQPVVNDNIKNTVQEKSNKIDGKVILDQCETSLDIPGEIFDLNCSKQFAGDLVMTQGFYEAVTQPFVPSDSTDEEIRKPDESICLKNDNLQTVSLKKNNVSILNKDDLEISLSDSFHNLNTQPVTFGETDQISSNKVIEEYVKDITKTSTKTNISDGGLGGNIEKVKDATITEDFYELATQPVTTDIFSSSTKFTVINEMDEIDVNMKQNILNSEISRGLDCKPPLSKNDSSFNTNNDQGKKSIDIKSAETDKTSLFEDENYTESFYELATQPVVDDKTEQFKAPHSVSPEKCKKLFLGPLGSNGCSINSQNKLSESTSGVSENTICNLTIESNKASELETNQGPFILPEQYNPLIDPLNDFLPDPKGEVVDENIFEAATEPFSGDNMKQDIDKSTTLISEKSTDCRTVLMELSESIFTLTQGQSKDDKISDLKTAFNSLDKTENKTDKIKKVNDTVPNRTIQDDVDMSISCINLHDILKPQAPKNILGNVSNDVLKTSSQSCSVGNKKMPTAQKNIEDPDIKSTQDLLKILQGDEDNIMENMNEGSAHKQKPDNSKIHELSEQTFNNEDTLKNLPEKTTDIKYCAKEKGSTHRRKIMKKGETITFSSESSQGNSPVIVTRRKTMKLNSSDENEQSSEEFVIRGEKKGCNIFPPDTEDFMSSENDQTLIASVAESRSQSLKNMNEQNSLEHTICDESQQSSEDIVIKFKRKNTNAFPPDSEPFEYCNNADNDEQSKETSTHAQEQSNNSDSPVSKENNERETPKKNKSSTERDQSYISRGNITLHSQEVLEELEEQFRLTAVAMSPTQLSVANESDDELQIDVSESPVIRRSERKRSENVVYKPLVNINNKDDMTGNQKKVGVTSMSKVKKKISGQDNVTSPKQSNSSAVTFESIETKSVKKFKKATPTKEQQSSCNEENINNNSNNFEEAVLENIKKDSLDCSDSQNSLSSNLESSENELGRGKRKRVRTSFDGFILVEDFKKNRKKSSSPLHTSDSQIIKTESKDVKIEKPLSSSDNELSQTMTQKLSVVLHDINKKPSCSASTSKAVSNIEGTQNSFAQPENDEDDLILPPKKSNVCKSKAVINKDSSKIDEKKNTGNVSSSKANTTSLCEKLDELFNIWGPADRVKLSPRAPKKTYKIIQNEQKNTSRKIGDENSNQINDKQKSIEKEKPKNSTRRTVSPKNKKSDSRASSQNEKLDSQGSNSAKPTSSRRLAMKHKITETSNNEPIEKRVRKTRSNSLADSSNSSEINENLVSSGARRRSNRSDASSSSTSDEKRKRAAINSLHNGENLSPSPSSKKKKKIDSKNNSQEITNESSTSSSPPKNNSSSRVTKTSKSKSKRINQQEVPSKNNNNIKNSKQKNTSPSINASSPPAEDFYIMSQEFSFRSRSDCKKTPLKEDFKPPELKVRRSARSKNSEKKMDTEKIMFTGLSDNKFSAMVTKLGGEVVDSPFTCTVLITDKVRRTTKFLSALSRGVPIVSPNWLSNSSGSFADVNKFLVNDSEAEKSYSFSLKKSLEKARATKLLDGWSIYVTPSVNPPPEDMKGIIECSGGKCLIKEPARWPPNSLIISCEEDKEKWKSLIKRGKRPPVVETEALFSGILQQNLKVEKYRLI